MRKLMLLIMSLTTIAAEAQIYMCEDHGQRTYSQQPCGQNAQSVNLGQRNGAMELPERLDTASSARLCEMMVHSWELAAQMRSEHIDIRKASQRIFGYVREHISNYEERSQRDISLYSRLRTASDNITYSAYSSDSPTSDERNVAVRQCQDQVMSHAGSGSPVSTFEGHKKTL